MEKINVLVFPAGEINAVELHTALASCVNVNLFGASSTDRHGPFVFKNYMSRMPYITEENFIDRLNQVIKTYAIDLVIPTHDSVALFFAENKALIKAKILTADYETAMICRSKKKMYALFSDCLFIPHIYGQQDDFSFPIFIKPDESQGGKGATLIQSRSEFETVEGIEDFVVSEVLPGDELTVDCLTDNTGKLRGVFPRNRNRVFCGVSVAGKALEVTSAIMEIADAINQRLHFLGLWFFQLKQDKTGSYKLMEISTRVAGGMCLTRARGVNLPLLSVYTAMGYDIEVFTNSYAVEMDRTLINRYKTDITYKHVYLDFDDTVITHGKVNLDMIRFIYQCINQGKKIHLLTKHEQNITSSLKHFHISMDLFNDIIQIPLEDEKYKFIAEKDAIYIDNSYRERQAVMINCGIPVFDVDTIEVLLDWRK